MIRRVAKLVPIRRRHPSRIRFRWWLLALSLFLSASFGTFARAEELPPLGVGIFGGVMLPSEQHDLHEEKLQRQTYPSVAPELGLRLEYAPWTYLSLEGEGAFVPTTLADGSPASITAFRAQLGVRLPLKGWTPFLLGGTGLFQGFSDTMGDDFDLEYHFGLGAIVPVSKSLALRVDARDTLSRAHFEDEYPHFPEFLVSLSYHFGSGSSRKKSLDPSPAEEEVEEEPEETSEPQEEEEEEPLREPEPEEEKPVAFIPEEPKDRDGDGVADSDDLCPGKAGTQANGCPPPRKPAKKKRTRRSKPRESRSSVDPASYPREVRQELSGVIDGVGFSTGASTISQASVVPLQRALKVLKEHPDVRILIVAHTDSAGKADANERLSMFRAHSIKKFFVERGIAPERLETLGAGESEPIATNRTPWGRKKNRRIEFRLLR